MVVVKLSRLIRPAPVTHPSVSIWKGAAVCAAVYFAATPLSAWITATGLPVWLSTGVALAALTRLGVVYWPMVLAAGWLSAIAMGYPPLVAAPLAASGLMEVLAGIAILQSASGWQARSRALNTVLSAAMIAAVVPAIGAIANATLVGIAWRTWWIKDAAGLLLFAPLWTLRVREAASPSQPPTTTADNLMNLRTAISEFETSPPVVVTENQETPVHRSR